MTRRLSIAILVAGLLTAAAAPAAQKAPAPASSANRTQGAEAEVPTVANAPVAFAPTTSSAKSTAPGPAPVTQRGQHASDSLATTQTSYNQIQTLGTFSSAHVAPPSAIIAYLNSSDAQAALPKDAYVPNSTEYTQLQLFDQLEGLGVRQFHFPIYYDPKGDKYVENAGLKIVGENGNLTAESDKWSYPGWKMMNEPDFDFNSTCVELQTCLYNIKNWLLSTPNTVPITIYLEPVNYTYTGADGSNKTFADALAASKADGPDSLAAPFDLLTYQPFYQPWRDLENEIQMTFNYDYAIVTPEELMGNDTDLASAVLKDTYTLYPALDIIKRRVFFVVTGDYALNYLQFKPDLENATMFIAEPYNSDGNYTDSTLFVDVVGPLDGTNYSASFNSSAADAAVKKQVDMVTETVKAGYMVRASADWNTWEPRYNYTGRFSKLITAGAHFLQTSFPTSPTLFNSTYLAVLPIRGNVQQSALCNPVTSGGVVINQTALYTVGCPAVNALTPAVAPASSAK